MQDDAFRKEPAAGGDAGAPRGGAPTMGGGDIGLPVQWSSRGYLPHRDRVHLLQAITFRLADSLPQTKLRELETELAALPERRRASQRRRRIEQWLDAGMGCCALRHPEAAAQVQDSLRHGDGSRYQLAAWVVMPNHVHVLVEPLAPVAAIVHGWKSFTSRSLLAANARLGLRIPDAHRVWMREYWDRFIRDADHLENVTDYIHQNPVKAGLCQKAADWQWSSAAPGSAGVPAGHPPVCAPAPRKMSDDAGGKEAAAEAAGGDASAPRFTAPPPRRARRGRSTAP